MADFQDLGSIIEYSVDLSKQDAPEPLPAGEYTAQVRSAMQKTSQRGTRYGEVAFHISSDQYPPDFTEGNPDGTTIMYRRVSLEDNAQARYGTKRFIEALGAPLGKKIDVNDWVGSEAAVEVGSETWEGTPRAVITRVRAT